jgi:hypothetical protein
LHLISTLAISIPPPASAKVLSPLKKVVASLVPVADNLASSIVLSDILAFVTEPSGNVTVLLDVSKVTPVGTVNVSPCNIS